MNERKTFKVKKEDGDYLEFEIIATFKIDKFKKHYIVYTDNSTNSEGYTNLYAGIFYPDIPEKEIEEITSEEEWISVENIINDLLESEDY